MVTVDDLRTRIKRQPFVPLRIKTSFGETVDVLDPQLVMYGINEITVGTPSRIYPGEGIASDVDRVSIPHVVAVEDLPADTLEKSMAF
jgi:hypothetical protein